MRIPKSAILSALRNGGVIRSFYRRSAKVSRSAGSVLADGYELESSSEQGDILLSYADFLSVKALLVEAETWEEMVGGGCLGAVPGG